MKVYQNINGGVIHSHREYDIDPTTKIHEGQVVDLVNGLVVPHAVGGTGAVLGVAAEYHGGTPDALDPRSNGPKISVWDGPGQVFRCPAPKLTALAGGSATTVKATLAGAASAYVGGWLKLVAKAEDSANTDAIGTVRRITAFSASDGTGTFTLTEGGVPAAGDEYVLFLPVGFAGGNLDANGQQLVVTATANLPLRVAGRIEETNEITIVPAKHVFGVTG